MGSSASPSPLASERRAPAALIGRPGAYGSSIYGFNPYSNLAPGGSAIGNLFAPPSLSSARVRNLVKKLCPNLMREQQQPPLRCVNLHTGLNRPNPPTCRGGHSPIVSRALSHFVGPALQPLQAIPAHPHELSKEGTGIHLALSSTPKEADAAVLSSATPMSSAVNAPHRLMFSAAAPQNHSARPLQVFHQIRWLLHCSDYASWYRRCFNIFNSKLNFIDYYDKVLKFGIPSMQKIGAFGAQQTFGNAPAITTIAGPTNQLEQTSKDTRQLLHCSNRL